MFKNLLRSIFRKNKNLSSGENADEQKPKKEKGKRSKKMDEETKKDEVVETTTKKDEEVKEGGETVKKEEVKKDEEVATSKEDEKATDTDNKTNDNNTDGDNGDETAPQVAQTEPTGNGIRVDELVTKDMLAERLSAMEAKFDAVIKENTDLKDKISKMEEKYEDKDFGTTQSKGTLVADKSANETFASYSKQFI